MQNPNYELQKEKELKEYFFYLNSQIDESIINYALCSMEFLNKCTLYIINSPADITESEILEKFIFPINPYKLTMYNQALTNRLREDSTIRVTFYQPKDLELFKLVKI